MCTTGMAARSPPPPRSRRPRPVADPRAAGNRALAAMLGRKVGWDKAGAANAGERQSSGLRRIPLEGLKGGDFPSRAIVILPAATAGSANVDVLLHLHGYTPGYAGAKPDDEGVYRIEEQLAASKRELIGILPQGGATADFNAGAGKAFDADNFIKAVFARLTAEGAWDTEQGPASRPRDPVGPQRRRPADHRDAQQRRGRGGQGARQARRPVPVRQHDRRRRSAARSGPTSTSGSRPSSTTCG